MRRMFVFLPLLIVPAWMAHSQNPVLGKTGDFVNGRYWKGLPDLAKAAYLTALAEAVTQVPFEGAPSSRALSAATCILDTEMSLYQSFSVENATYREAVDELDAFYREPANLRIPVLAAVKYTVMKMKGSSKSALEACEADLRKGAVEPLPITKCSPH